MSDSTSIAIDSTGLIHISHYDPINGDLRYCNNTGGTWNCIAPDTVGTVGKYSSIAIGSTDKIYISHFDDTNDNLRYCTNNWTASWECISVEDADGSFLGSSNGRQIAIKKGRIVDTTSFSETVHISWYNNTNLIYSNVTKDLAPPTITIAQPQPQVYSTNESLSLNYTITDSGIGVDSCWFKVLNSTDDIQIDNLTLASCANTTFNVSREDTYSLTLYSNDTLDNLNSSNVSFSVSISAPAVVLDAPSDDAHLSSGVNVYLNYTATDSSGLDTCQLWHNNTGTWHKNYTWIGPTSGTQNYTTLNLSEITSIWNVWCNDTADNSEWALNNFTLTVDETNPSVNITTTNDTAVTGLSITINYNISDTNINTCYFTLKTLAGVVHNYAENASLSCSSSRSISTISHGTFVIQIWGEDKAENLGDANLTFTTRAIGPTTSGGGSTFVVSEDKKTFCGDLICQEPNGYGVIEDFWNCPQDCKGFDLDALVFSFTKYCLDKDPLTICFFTQTLFSTVPGVGEESLQENMTFYREGQVCFGEICGRLSGKTLFTNCFKGGPCFWQSNTAFLSLFGFGALVFGISFVKIRAPGITKKVSPYQYISIKYRKRRKKWRKI